MRICVSYFVEDDDDDDVYWFLLTGLNPEEFLFKYTSDLFDERDNARKLNGGKIEEGSYAQGYIDGINKAIDLLKIR